MKIFIDNIEADLDRRTNVAISLSVASHTQLEASRTGYSKTITIPMTRRNMGIMGDSEQVNAPSMFNRGEHTARVEHDGCTVIEGTPHLVESSCGGPDGGFYRLNIIGPGKRWVKYAMETPLHELGIEFNEVLGGETIARSWTWDKPVRFLPVQRDGYAPDNANGSLFEPQKILANGDYYPFLHVKSLVDKIFAGAGYTVESAFMPGLLFDSLYVSGNYPSVDSGRFREQMDFLAGRYAASSVTSADANGRVYASPYMSSNKVGNLVETANPNEARNGVKVPGVFSAGNCFRVTNQHIEFRPTQPVSMAFEYTLHYTTDYKILTRDRLTGFDTVYLGDGQERKFTLANRFVDRRSDVIPGNVSYKLMIFDHKPGNTYFFSYKRITNPNADPNDLKAGDYTEARSTMLSGRMNTLTLSTTNKVADMRLLWDNPELTAYEEYPYDWAVYDGYVTESGTTDVEVTLRSSVERVLPSQPKTFYDIYFAGATPGSRFILGNRTAVRPIFEYGPTEGMALDFASVATHNISCFDLIDALRQMFNLYFLTDQVTRTVYVEPRMDFYTATPVVDWSNRIDLSKPVTVSEPGADMYRTLSFGYAGGDAAVAAYNRSNGGGYGSWSARVHNMHAREGERSYRNPVFHASINERGGLNTAPSALLLLAGATEDGTAAGGGDMNFPPKIVRYLGLKPLPAGEQWGWPGSGGDGYPFVAFHYKGDVNGYPDGSVNPQSTFGEDIPTLWQNGLSLCFEDRDGVAGLHRFWDGNIAALNESKRVELSLMLYPEEIEAMLSPNTLGRDFRALYRLVVDGESSLFRLEEVCDYNPADGGSTRCVFIKENF